MDIAETTRLCRAIAAIKPAQHFDVETPALWALILADIRYEDARQAVINLAGKTRFIDPADLIAEVKAIRRERLEHSDRILPDVGPDDVGAWLAARREGVRALADGRVDPPKPPPAALDGWLAEALPRVLPRPSRVVAAIEGGPRPSRVAPVAALSAQDAARLEAERDRQRAELAPLVEAEVCAGTATEQQQLPDGASAPDERTGQ